MTGPTKYQMLSSALLLFRTKSGKMTEYSEALADMERRMARVSTDIEYYAMLRNYAMLAVDIVRQ